MANIPISAFAPLPAADLHGDDYLPIVDVHDTTQSLSGTTKRVTVDALYTDAQFTGTTTVETLAATEDAVVAGMLTVTEDVASSHFVGGGDAPTVAFHSTPDGVVSVTGTDTAGVIEWTPSGTASGAAFRLSFARPFAVPPVVVAGWTGPVPVNTAVINTDNRTTDTVDVVLAGSLGSFFAGTPYLVSYLAVGV